MASANGYINIVDYLIRSGVDVNASNTERNTPLHWACLNGHIEMLLKVDHRLDEWTKLEHLDLKSVETDVDEKVEDKVTSLKMTRHQKRKIDETHVEGHEELDAASLREHEEFTKVKNIATIELGRYEIETWYFSPFPPEYNECTKLFFCEFCLNFMKRKEQLQRHMRKCDLKHPPGDEIYRNGTLSMFEIRFCTLKVNGKKNKV
ncbi:Antigen peptide transporter 2 [Castilleja foliolosa]|uniref:Histone acetyltransferase n=1 Tax=Castilleja foliolosa TaxID=1961234 RepID=A0ABD3BAW8_9LAMI